MNLYSVGTWDEGKQAYTPQRGLTVPSYNITLAQLRQAVRDLRRLGYEAHRIRGADGSHMNNDWASVDRANKRKALEGDSQSMETISIQLSKRTDPKQPIVKATVTVRSNGRIVRAKPTEGTHKGVSLHIGTQFKVVA